MTTETAVKEKPILFSGPMVRAILDGRKLQTRRVIKQQPALSPNGEYWHWPHLGGIASWLDSEPVYRQWSTERLFESCPYGQPGDRLWVRETWGSAWVDSRSMAFVYKATDEDNVDNPRWRPSIHMPRIASRITLEITDVRVERIQDISEADAIAEGAEIECKYWKQKCNSNRCRENHYRAGFQALWDSINAKRGFGWQSNVWVWVVEFKRLEAST